MRGELWQFRQNLESRVSFRNNNNNFRLLLGSTRPFSFRHQKLLHLRVLRLGREICMRALSFPETNFIDSNCTRACKSVTRSLSWSVNRRFFPEGKHCTRCMTTAPRRVKPTNVNIMTFSLIMDMVVYFYNGGQFYVGGGSSGYTTFLHR